MLKKSHILVADNMMSNLESMLDWKINRRAYLFGSIAPDFNFIYPAHRITSTLRRFQKKVLRVERSDSILIKSFTLGVITHYICDYFCYAHNIAVIDRRHPFYELRLKNHIELHERQIGHDKTGLIKQWDSIKKHILEEFIREENTGRNQEEIINSICSQSNDHIKYIIEAVNDMHEAYINETKTVDENTWHISTNKMSIDLEYAAFMCEKIIALIFEPSKELSYVAYGI